MRNEFLTIGQRIKYLMDQKQIKNAPALAEAMTEAGIIKYAGFNRDEAEITLQEHYQYIAKSINNHLRQTDVNKLSIEWIKRYCDFFHCSADYLLGYDSMPSPAISSVHDQTGLSEKAIKILQDIYSRNRATGRSEALSHIIEDPDFQYLLTVIKLKSSGSFDLFTIGDAAFKPEKQAVIEYQTEMAFHDLAKRVRERPLSSPEAIRNLYKFAYCCYDDGSLTEDQLDDVIAHYDQNDFEYCPEGIRKEK